MLSRTSKTVLTVTGAALGRPPLTRGPEGLGIGRAMGGVMVVAAAFVNYACCCVNSSPWRQRPHWDWQSSTTEITP